MSDDFAFETRAIHAGQSPDPDTGAVMPPIYATSTYAQDTPGDHRGYEYSRTGNPTRSALEANLANLEGAAHARAFASGMAAVDAVCRLLEAGDHVVCGNDVYGGTRRLFDRVYDRHDVRVDYVEATDPDAVAAACGDDTALVWVETPTNPLLRVVDIRELAAIAHDHGAWCVVDNTFATPYLQRPIEYGADVVCHSLTKYLGGHSDVVGGALVTDDAALDERLGFIQNAVGATLDPFACFLVLRGTKTLAIRMARHCEVAGSLATWLDGHDVVEHVYYPGLSDHPQHSLAARQMNDFGGMLSVELDASLKATSEVVSSTAVFTLAESLGGVESLIEQPAAMTHASVPRADRLAAGLTDGLIRLSVGIESVADLRADLQQAFERVLG